MPSVREAIVTDGNTIPLCRRKSRVVKVFNSVAEAGAVIFAPSWVGALLLQVPVPAVKAECARRAVTD